MSSITNVSRKDYSRKAPYRKQKTLGPGELQQFLRQENISGYPVDVSNIQVSCSNTFCAAITSAKTVIAWGRDFVNVDNQTKVPFGLNDVIQVATANDMTLALRGDGTVVHWGNYKKPYYQFLTKEIRDVVRIEGGGENFLLQRSDGKLFGFGSKKTYEVNDIPPQVYSGSPIVDMTLGFYHAVVLLEDGTVVCWGNEINNHLDVPRTDSKFVSVKAYNEFTLALKENGTLAGWGTRRYGQQNIPQILTTPGNSPVISYAVGKYHCAAITEDNQVHTWGWDVSPGDIIYTPVLDDYLRQSKEEKDPRFQKYLIAPPNEILESNTEKPVRIFAGNDITFVLTNTGDLIGWGSEDYDLIKVPEIIPPLERPGQPNIDLVPYGLNLDIDSVIKGDYKPSVDLIASIKNDNSSIIETQNGVYRKIKKLGEGGYGKVYELEKDGAKIVVKVQKLKRTDSIPNLLLEVAIQIIMQEEPRRLNAGYKICPDIYEIGFNAKDKTFYIFQEKVDIEMENDFALNSGKLTSRDIANVYTQIAIKLNWLYDNLEFNHRDLKADNVMFKYDSSGQRIVYLIDFGLSCLTYRGIRVKTKNYFQNEKCFEETRDMSFILYDMYTRDPDAFPKDIGGVIRDMLYFKVKGQPCNLVSGRCDLKKLDFKDYYDILNLEYIYNPNTTTDVVIEKMAPFLA